MALTILKTVVDAATIEAADWNAEFNNIYNNPMSLISPMVANLAAGGFDITNIGLLLVNDTTNGNMTTGLTAKQDAGVSNQVFALKSGDVSTGITSLPSRTSETDDIFHISKSSALQGGVLFTVLHEDDSDSNPVAWEVYGGTASTTQTTAAQGLYDIFLAEHNGSNTIADITNSGVVFTIRARVGGASVARFLIDEDGDMITVNAGGTFDEEDDLQLVEDFDLVNAAMVNPIDKDWEEFVRAKENKLIELKILTGPVVGAPLDNQGMLSLPKLCKLQNGAIRRLTKKFNQMEQKLLALENSNARYTV